jgi:hypothetical protein
MPNAARSQPTSVKGTDMVMPDHFRGLSGNWYRYIPMIPHHWKNPANYMFARISGQYWFIPYIGQTGDSSDRFPKHDRWQEAVRDYGVTHVLMHFSSSDLDVRETEERDLIASLDPPMNRQHRPIHTGLINTPMDLPFGLAALGRYGTR